MIKTNLFLKIFMLYGIWISTYVFIRSRKAPCVIGETIRSTFTYI